MSDDVGDDESVGVDRISTLTPIGVNVGTGQFHNCHYYKYLSHNNQQ